MKFYIPKSMLGITSSDLTDRDVVPFYINPQDITISDSKIISSQQTKGGFMTQYWGEELSKIRISGVTGSGGIEAINILRDVYRHEQVFFSRELVERKRKFQNLAEESLLNASTSVSAADVIASSDITGLTREIITAGESFSDLIENGGFTGLFSVQAQDRDILTIAASPAAYAMSIDLVFQGEKFRGYFSNFSMSERADSAGHFNYDMDFVVLRRAGKRKNFMPWHRRPTDINGSPISASIPTDGAREDELSVESTQTSIIGDRFISSTFLNTQEAEEQDANNVGVNRFDKLKR